MLENKKIELQNYISEKLKRNDLSSISKTKSLLETIENLIDENLD